MDFDQNRTFYRAHFSICPNNETLLNYNLLWNTTYPKFTRCSQKTIPLLIPVGFLLLFAPMNLFFSWQRKKRLVLMGLFQPIPVSVFNSSKLLMVAVIVLVNLASLLKELFFPPADDAVYATTSLDIVCPILNVFNYLVLGLMIHFYRALGIRSSGVIWLFSFLSFVFLLPSFYMRAMRFFLGSDWLVEIADYQQLFYMTGVECALFAVHFIAQATLFVLNWFPDLGTGHNKVVDSAFTPSSSSIVCKVENAISQRLTSDNQNKRLSVIDANFALTTTANRARATFLRRTECPEPQASFLSKICYHWFTPLVVRGFRKELTLNNIWRLRPKDTSNEIAPILDRAWISQFVTVCPDDLSSFYDHSAEFPGRENFVLKPKSPQTGKRKAQPRAEGQIVIALVRAFGWSFLHGATFKFFHDCIQFIAPFLLKMFIDFISKDTELEPNWHGYLITILFMLTATTSSMLLNYYFYRMYLLGNRVQASLISAIYRKSLSLSNSAFRRTTTGEIVNLMSVDAQRFVDLLPYLNLIWSAPLQICLIIYFIWQELGPSVLSGVAIITLLIPVNWYFNDYQRKLQVKQMKKKDDRVRVINEVLQGMRVIKLYAWEVPFMKKIGTIRSKEIVQLREIAFLQTITSFIWTCAPFLVSFSTFAVYVLSSDENVLDAKRAFVSLLLFNLLQFPLSMLPRTVSMIFLISISVKRLNKFLNASQLEDYVERVTMDVNDIEIDNGSFCWELPTEKEAKEHKGNRHPSTSQKEDQEDDDDTDDEDEIELKRLKSLNRVSITLPRLSLRIKKGSLVAVVGPVGSGKSSLLSAINGDIERLSGTVRVQKESKIAFMSQQAWIRNATLRDNILFGAPYNEARYQACLKMCALEPDIEILPGGDLTEIGEKGINLSGGQKQRVAIARACYAQCDIILMDDPLSAVDSHVRRHIFDQAIANKTGYLKNSTRVVVTNNVQVLSQVDNILVVINGRIAESGTYDELMQKNNQFARFVSEHSSIIGKCKNKEFGEYSKLRHESESSGGSLKRQVDKELGQKLIAPEAAQTGEVKASVYWYYFKSLSLLWMSMILIGYVGIHASSVCSNVWLALWSDDHKEIIPLGESAVNVPKVGKTNLTMEDITEHDIAQRNHRLAVFGVLGFFQALFVLFAAIAKEKALVMSSISLHKSLIESIMRSPMQFFDTTPLGRIVNRFAKDINSVDQTLPHCIHSWLMAFLQVASTLLLIIIQVPIFMVVSLPIVVVYYVILKFYVSTSRQLKRLESVTRSPIYSHFSETLTGVSTIRAFNATRWFIAECNHRMDQNMRCYFPSCVDNRWLALRVEWIGNCIVFFTAFFAVLYRVDFRNHPAFVGLIVTYALSITQTLNWLVRQTSEMETNIVSVERIGEYCKLVPEKDWKRPPDALPILSPDWPNNGKIRFVNYSVRYRAGLDLALKDINISIAASEKIGIVGRTGSGKSTITLALFRILEAASGWIFIDDIEVSTIGLHELRSKITIIPQDPVLFSGSIRSNLDPFNQHNDDQIWRALRLSHLGDYFQSHESGLAFQVAESGVNLSVGQRQLVCLARALLRRTKILVLDEATASIDLENDALIQATIREEFADCTVLTIAHRLHTILDSHRILVLDRAEVIEFDSPTALLADENSHFYSLAKDSGLI